MEQIREPFIVGHRAKVAAYIDLDTYKKLEQKRGMIGRSAFIGAIIENALNENEKCEA
ncbi:hypothetical protein [Methanosarcina sp. 1.H.T.1A.1]|uniref:hypothetical protein n=1 Tax=Methanosarcina sp. 1.H.T.1A.1 TaxID=1483602 RepID=UPI000A421197|nr:hypothetical protein [Methanosarcina sp. 1.H.T.1A.1]